MTDTQKVELKSGAIKKQALRPKWDTLTDWARAQGAVLLRPVAQFVGHLGLHPNLITLMDADGRYARLFRLQAAGYQ